jgi:serine/threonine protein kinase
MGRVYLALDTNNFNRQCIVKEMLPYYSTPEEKVEAERNFERECQLLAALNYPAGIPQIYDHFTDGGNFYLIMTLIEGEDLEKRMAKAPDGRLSEKEVIEYALQVCNILVYLANRQPPVIHRDLKPANLIVSKDSGHVMLVDFGIAKATRVTGTVGGAINTASWQVLKSSPLGTAGYAPPEQYQGATEPRSDVYALGATMHHLLTGRSPQSAGSPFDFPPVRTFVPTLSEGIERVVARALTMNVNTRPTAAQLKPELEALATPSVVQSVSAAGPFHFRSGDTANTIPELAQKAEARWNDGVYHLYQGHLDAWLRGQNRHDLATVAEGIRQRHTDQSAGLEEFLRALNPQLQPPALMVGTPALDFGAVSKGEARELDVQVANRGRGYLYGTLKSNAPWLTVAAPHVGCLPGATQTIKVGINTRALKEGSHGVAAALEIDTNGGRQALAAQVQVTWAPALTIAPSKRLDFGDVPVGTGAPVTRLLTISNSGGGTLEGRITWDGGWFSLAGHDFWLASGQKMDVQAMANSAGLRVGIYAGQVTISSNVGQVVLPARLGVKKALYELPSRAMRWGVFAALALISLFLCSLTPALGARGILGLKPINLLGGVCFDLMQRFTTATPQVRTAGDAFGAMALLAFGMIGLMVWSAARMMNRSLDEIESYYHGGNLARLIAPSHFDAWRYLLITVLLTIVGVMIGIKFNTTTSPTRDWVGWGLLIGPLAGMLIGGGLTIAGARIGSMVDMASHLSAFERVFFVASGMATWGAMLSVTRSVRAQSEWMPAFVWAIAGFVLVSDSVRLPARLQWILSAVRPGLIIALFGYIIGASTYALISFFRFGQASFIPIDAFYTSFPGWTDAIQVVVDVMYALAILVGGLSGLAAVNDASFQRGRVAKAVGMALLPSLLLGVIGMAIGAVAFWVLTLGRGWSLGVLFAVAGAVAAGLAVFRAQGSRLERGEQVLKMGAARLLKNRPLPQWLDRFSLVALTRDLTPAAISVTAMMTALLLPLAMQIALSLLILLVCLGVIAVGIAVVLFVIFIAARSQTAKQTP